MYLLKSDPVHPYTGFHGAIMMVFGGQKSAKFVILSQNHPAMMGHKFQKIQNFRSNSQKNSKKQYYGTFEKIKIKPKIRQRD